MSNTLTAAGQLLLKAGIGGGVEVVDGLLLASGAASLALAMVVYLHVLGSAHLSWAYGFNGLSYTITSILALAFLGEQVPPLRWLGVAVITIGTLIVGFS